MKLGKPLLGLMLLAGVYQSWGQSSDCPVLKKYSGDKLTEVSIPLGGIGTGTISIGGRGDLRDWVMSGTFPNNEF